MTCPPPLLLRARRLFRKLWRANSGTALLELAISLPVLTTLGMYGTEIAYLAVVNLQVSEIAISVADNASRLGQTDNSTVAPSVSEADVASVMKGALKQGEMIKLQANGRIILSSLEYNSSAQKQFIHWQRCVGTLSKSSEYGNDSTRNGLTGTAITGMGKGTTKASATDGAPVMFAEVFYQHRGLFGTLFLANNLIVKREAAFIVRDNRDLASGVTGTNGTTSCGS